MVWRSSAYRLIQPWAMCSCWLENWFCAFFWSILENLIALNTSILIILFIFYAVKWTNACEKKSQSMRATETCNDE